jgi:large subunit ribosomal protein L25
MSKIVALTGQERTLVGKGAARAIRREHSIPAIIYGGGKKEVMLSLHTKELTKLYNNHGFFSHLYEIAIGKEKFKAIPKHVQLHPVTDAIEHVDFLHVDAKTKVKVQVELEIVNKAKCIGVKQGGILNVLHLNIELLCDPAHIPEVIEVDVADLEIGGVIHIKDLKLPKDVEPTAVESYTICTVLGASKIEEEAVEVVAEGATEEAKK